MGQVSLSVNGSIYRMACEDGEEDHVAQLGERLDGAIEELRSAVGAIGDQRLLVMAGILMTDRLDAAEQRLAHAERRLLEVEEELRGLRESRQQTSARLDGAEKRFVERLEAAAERIERLVRRLQGPPR